MGQNRYVVFPRLVNNIKHKNGCGSLEPVLYSFRAKRCVREDVFLSLTLSSSQACVPPPVSSLSHLSRGEAGHNDPEGSL